MKLIYIYGPPAVGKLTVARELAKLTDYKVFHNHLTSDLVESVFDRGTKTFTRLNIKYRYEIIGTAAQENIKGLIVTFVYAQPDDDKYIEKIVNKVKKHKGQVYFVQLICDVATLKKRLKHPARKEFAKLKRVKPFKEILNQYKLFESVPYDNNLIINNTKLSPKKAAQKIKKLFKLDK